MRRRRTPQAVLALFIALAMALAVFPAAAEDSPTRIEMDDAARQTLRELLAQAPSSGFDAGTYFVIFDGDPVVAYEGDIKGLPATKPAPGKKVDPNSAKDEKYQDFLTKKQDQALSRAGVGLDKKLYNYTMAIDAVSARLTGDQAEALAKADGVLAVQANRMYELDTISTPTFLGIDQPGGLWDSGYDGDGVVVGIIDSGIWPEHPSVSDRTEPSPSNGKGNGKGQSKLSFQQIPGWHGKCTPGEDFQADECNQKLIGAQWYGEGFGGEAGVKETFPYEFWSARDADGHGTHTATTAAGNGGVAAEVDGLGVIGTASGMAPRARIAAYKACWGFGDDPNGGCSGVDLVAAIDQAVADGVDVINYSISGTRTNFADAVEISFLFAADAGIFVAASAGNSGPGASTVAHPSPWITTVAAGTHDRYFEADVTIYDDDSELGTYSGASFQVDGLAKAPVVYAGDIPAAGVDAADAAICDTGTLDPAAAAGKIVFCDRGEIARVAKSAEVAAAGGIGMIHGNVGPNSVNADLHFVPTVHLDDTSAASALADIQGAADPMASFTPGLLTPDPSAPEPASFSSRGPLAASSDLLKPDVMAPGVDVIAGVSPIGNSGRLFDSYSGTSMSSPHIAGLAAAIMSKHPTWSPAAVKSALMTTSDDTPASAFAEGSGHVVPNSAVDPGLVYDVGWNDYLGFLCGTTGLVSSSTCDILESRGYSSDTSQLNQPNITIGALAGEETITRTVTNVGPAGTYEVSVVAPPGTTVDVTPSELTLATGEDGEFDVHFTVVDGAVYGDYAFGSLTWSDGDHSVRSVLTVVPTQASFPTEVFGGAADGSDSIEVAFGYSGEYTPAVAGLVAPLTIPSVLEQDPDSDYETYDEAAGIDEYAFAMPTSQAVVRFATFDDFTDGEDDLDLYVYAPNPNFVYADFPSSWPWLELSSAAGTSDEAVTLVLQESNPDYDQFLADYFGYPPNVWFADVHAWATDGPDVEYTFFVWSVEHLDAGNMAVVDPGDALLGTSTAVDYSWAGLDPATKYLGAITHDDGGGPFGATIVSIDVP
jgi:subtilisin family serine protease